MRSAAGLGILNLHRGEDPQLDWCDSPSHLPKSESIQARPQLISVTFYSVSVGIVVAPENP
jgi:hypothetical protein